MHLRKITVHASGLRQTRMTKRKRFITNTHAAFATAAAAYRLMGFFLFATIFSQSNTQNRVLIGILCLNILCAIA